MAVITALCILGYDAWHTSIWGVSPILLSRSSQALSGWMGSLSLSLFIFTGTVHINQCFSKSAGFSQPANFQPQSLHSYFQSPEMFDWVHVRALAGPLTDIQRLVRKPLLRCLGFMLRVIALLEGEPSPKSEVLSALEQVFIKDLYVLCSVHLPRS